LLDSAEFGWGSDFGCLAKFGLFGSCHIRRWPFGLLFLLCVAFGKLGVHSRVVEDPLQKGKGVVFFFPTPQNVIFTFWTAKMLSLRLYGSGTRFPC